MSNVLLADPIGLDEPGDDTTYEAFTRSLQRCSLTVAQPAHGDAHRRVAARSPRARDAAFTLGRTDVVVIGGGTVFTRLHPSTGQRPNARLRWAAGIIAAARARGAAVALIGVGAGDLAGGETRFLARWIVRHSDLLVLSDEESAGVLGAVGAPVPLRIGADPVWTVVGPSLRPVDGAPGSSVTVAIDHLAADDTFVERMTTALAPLAQTCPLRLQLWRGGDELGGRLTGELAMRLGDGVDLLASPSHLTAARDGFRHDRLVVAMHVHALIAAAAAGTPVLTIAHEPRLAGLARRLGQPSVPPHASGEVLRQAVGDALDHPAASTAAVTREVARATQTMGLLQLLVDRGAVDEPARIVSPPLSAGASW